MEAQELFRVASPGLSRVLQGPSETWRKEKTPQQRRRARRSGRLVPRTTRALRIARPRALRAAKVRRTASRVALRGMGSNAVPFSPVSSPAWQFAASLFSKPLGTSRPSSQSEGSQGGSPGFAPTMLRAA